MRRREIDAEACVRAARTAQPSGELGGSNEDEIENPARAEVEKQMRVAAACMTRRGRQVSKQNRPDPRQCGQKQGLEPVETMSGEEAGRCFHFGKYRSGAGGVG